MIEIKKVKDHKVFAEKLAKNTECNVRIKVIGKNHVHYEFGKSGVALGILCIDNGTPSFAPLKSFSTVTNDSFVSGEYFSFFDNFSLILNELSSIFVDWEDIPNNN